MAGFQIPMVEEGEIKKKRRIGRIYSETELLNILSIRTTGNLVESFRGGEENEIDIMFPQAVEFYLAGTFTDGVSYFFEMEYESAEIEGIDGGLFETQSRMGIGKEFFLMIDLSEVIKNPFSKDRPGMKKDMQMKRGRAAPMIMGPMVMVGKIDPSTNFSYPTNRQFILNVPGKVNEKTGIIHRFGLAPYAFSAKFFGIQTAEGDSVEVTKEVLYNTKGDFGIDLHVMIGSMMIQAGLMQGLQAGTSDVNQKKDPYLMGRFNFGSDKFLSGNLSGIVYWGNDTGRVPRTEGSSNTVLIDWLRYGFSGNLRYKLLNINGAVLWDEIQDLPDATLKEFDKTAFGVTVEGDFIASDQWLLSLRYDHLDAGGFAGQKTNGKVLAAQARYYLRDNLAFYLRDSYNIKQANTNALRNFKNLIAIGADLDF